MVNPTKSLPIGATMLKVLETTLHSSNPRYAETCERLKNTWLKDYQDIYAKYIPILLEMSARNERRPPVGSDERQALIHLTDPGSIHYRAEVFQMLSCQSPGWFLGKKEGKEQNKKQLIELAKSGAPKPHASTRLGKALKRYINSTHTSYDEKFKALIHRLRPDWIERSSDRNKAHLLELAKNGAPRPVKGTKLGWALCDYTRFGGKTYDKIFDAQIRALRPDWFEDASLREKKRRLMSFAKQGESLPQNDEENFVWFVSPTSDHYDCWLIKMLTDINSDWFFATAKNLL